MNNIISLLNSANDEMNIYRYMKAEHLAEWFDKKTIRMANPETWDDPFEKFMREAIFAQKIPQDHENGEIFGLCFSKNGASDALWKIYSPTGQGLRICTTIGKLRSQLAISPQLTPGRTFIGKVNYTNGEGIKATADSIRQRGPKKSSMRLIAKAMMEKRVPLKFEEEGNPPTFDGSGK